MFKHKGEIMKLGAITELSHMQDEHTYVFKTESGKLLILTDDDIEVVYAAYIGE
jgi:hypothetical protein